MEQDKDAIGGTIGRGKGIGSNIGKGKGKGQGWMKE
jgi:hypothetical protein